MAAHPLKRFGIRAALMFAVVTAALSSDMRNQTAPPSPPPSSEFQFVRLAYGDNTFTMGRRERWLTDWPEAEQHLIPGLLRLTRVDVAKEGLFLAIMDQELFDYPWLYAVEVGGWYLSDEEAARLRDYLLRGGFLMVDDFHGTYEWAEFAATMRRVFPDRPIVDIPMDDPVFHMAFDLEDRVQIPGIQVLYSGSTSEKDGYDPQWRGIYDDDGNLMVMINFNMDLGDAWEHADTPEYSLLYTNRAYQYAVNYVLYAMTH